MSKLAESIQKLLYDLLDMAIDKEVSTWEDAQRQAKKADLKKIGLYIDTKQYLLSGSFDQFILQAIEPNHEGSSYAEGNLKLYPVMDKHAARFLAKQIFGVVMEVILDSFGPIGWFANEIGNPVNNHAMHIDYKNIKTDKLRERKYIIFDPGAFDVALGAHWSDIKYDF